MSAGGRMLLDDHLRSSGWSHAIGRDIYHLRSSVLRECGLSSAIGRGF